VSQVRIQEAASWRLDEIYRYTRERWGEAQAERYITGLFDAFGQIESHAIPSRPVPAELGVQGFFFRYAHHFVYWRRLSNGDIGIVTILHERMHQIERLRDDFFETKPPDTDSSPL
jgi:toxin ParE1/3/4